MTDYAEVLFAPNCPNWLAKSKACAFPVVRRETEDPAWVTHSSKSRRRRQGEGTGSIVDAQPLRVSKDFHMYQLSRTSRRWLKNCRSKHFLAGLD